MKEPEQRKLSNLRKRGWIKQKHLSTTKLRKPNGNMLTLVTLTIGFIIAIGMSGFTFNSFLFEHKRAQGDADSLAIQLAQEINEGDRVGQLNELQQCSRELLYLSGKDRKMCSDEDFAFLAPLCNQLESEARSGHALLERERQNQIELMRRKMRELAAQHNDAKTSNFYLNLPWLQVRHPRVTRIDIGYINNVESNVKSLDVLKELCELDKRQGYIDPQTKLYKGNIKASIPECASDLNFAISSLPAHVKKTCAPARNTNPDVFIPTSTVFIDGSTTMDSIEQIPNAVQITCSMEAAFGLREKLGASVNLVSTASTNGAIAGSN